MNMPEWINAFRPLIFALALVTVAADVRAAAPTTAPSADRSAAINGSTASAGQEWSWVDLARRKYEINDQDPLKHVAEKMSIIHAALQSQHTGRPVQAKQNEVVSELDRLIALLEKACSGGGGGGANPTRPLADSVIAGGPGGQGDLVDPREGEKQWGQLPPRQREQIMQSATEGFPQGYEKILESYYRRLAQEQVSVEEAQTAETEQPSGAPAVP